MSDIRKSIREIANASLKKGDALSWFEEVYQREVSQISWADLCVNPHLLKYAEQNTLSGKALVVGCGLGDDAEFMSKHCETVAFDISESAIQKCRERFAASGVDYRVVNALDAPASFEGAFDFILEVYTLQVLPSDLRNELMKKLVSWLKPKATLLVIARGRDDDEDEGQMPWPLTKRELELFKTQGLHENDYKDFLDDETPPVRRLVVEYSRAP